MRCHPVVALRTGLVSVRGRAALAATAVVAVALAAAGLAVLFSLRADLTSEADRDAEEAGRAVAAQIALGRPYHDLDLPDAEDHPVQVVDATGRLLAAGEDLARVTGTGTSAVRPVPAAAAGPGHGDRQRPGGSLGDDDEETSDADDDDLRTGEIDDVAHVSGTATVDGESAGYRFAGVVAGHDRAVTVWAVAGLDDRDDAVRTAATVMLAGLPVLLLVVGSVTWQVTRRALRPVEGIRAEMAAVTASQDLARRVPEPDTRDEVARLARTTNETLAALEASVERQRRFVADASHELRSPIASLRAQLEVAAAHPGLLDVDGLVADTRRLERLAGDLLLLARLDAGEGAGTGRLDLAELVGEELPQRTGDRLPVRCTLAGAEVTGSRGQLARALGNLLDNAQRHARTRITVTVGARGGDAALTVVDDGTGVPDGERERIFARFVRLDDARSRDEGGAGLGLAIARDVARRHGGDLTVRTAPGGGALFELTLPGPRGPRGRPAVTEAGADQGSGGGTSGG